MTGASSAQQPTDPWDLPVPPRRAPVVVPNSWEDDEDDEDDEPLTERNRRLWNDANAKAPAPMPAVVSSTSILSPPPGAFQPTMRILKRPTGDGSGSTTSPVTPTLPNGLKEREAKYQAARHRIFGPASSGEESTSSGGIHANAPLDASSQKSSRSSGKQDKEQGRNPPSRSIIRDPRGPVSLDNVRGFQRQREEPTTVGYENDTEPDAVGNEGL